MSSELLACLLLILACGFNIRVETGPLCHRVSKSQSSPNHSTPLATASIPQVVSQYLSVVRISPGGSGSSLRYCLQHYEGDFQGAGLFTDLCPEAEIMREIYSVLSMSHGRSNHPLTRACLLVSFSDGVETGVMGVSLLVRLFRMRLGEDITNCRKTWIYHLKDFRWGWT